MALHFNDGTTIKTDLDDVPIAQAPAGFTTDLAGNPGSQCGILLGFASAFMLVMLLSVGLRFYTKARIMRCWSWDDLTLAVGVLGTTGVFTLTMMLGIISKVGSHVWNVPLGTILSGTTWANENECYDTLVPLTMGFVKITLFIYLYNTFTSNRSVRLIASTGLILTTLFYFAIVVASLSIWVPRAGAPIAPGISQGRVLTLNTIMLISACGGLILDLLAWTLPMVAIARLELFGRRTSGTACVFFIGLVALLAACMSVAYRIRSSMDWDSDFLFIGMPSVLCTFIELSSGCIAANLPTLVTFYRSVQGKSSRRTFGAGSDFEADGHLGFAFPADHAILSYPTRTRRQYLNRKASVLSDGGATITENMAQPFPKLPADASRMSSITALPRMDVEENGMIVQMQQKARKSSSADELSTSAAELAELDERAQQMTAKNFERFKGRDIEPWERWEALQNWPPKPVGKGEATRRYAMGD